MSEFKEYPKLVRGKDGVKVRVESKEAEAAVLGKPAPKPAVPSLANKPAPTVVPVEPTPAV